MLSFSYTQFLNRFPRWIPLVASSLSRSFSLFILPTKAFCDSLVTGLVTSPKLDLRFVLFANYFLLAYDVQHGEMCSEYTNFMEFGKQLSHFFRRDYIFFNGIDQIEQLNTLTLLGNELFGRSQSPSATLRKSCIFSRNCNQIWFACMHFKHLNLTYTFITAMEIGTTLLGFFLNWCFKFYAHHFY